MSQVVIEEVEDLDENEVDAIGDSYYVFTKEEVRQVARDAASDAPRAGDISYPCQLYDTGTLLSFCIGRHRSQGRDRTKKEFRSSEFGAYLMADRSRAAFTWVAVDCEHCTVFVTPHVHFIIQSKAQGIWRSYINTYCISQLHDKDLANGEPNRKIEMQVNRVSTNAAVGLIGYIKCGCTGNYACKQNVSGRGDIYQQVIRPAEQCYPKETMEKYGNNFLEALHLSHHPDCFGKTSWQATHSDVFDEFWAKYGPIKYNKIPESERVPIAERKNMVKLSHKEQCQYEGLLRVWTSDVFSKLSIREVWNRWAPKQTNPAIVQKHYAMFDALMTTQFGVASVRETFRQDVNNWLSKAKKMNTLWIYGPANVGKTLFGTSIARLAAEWCFELSGSQTFTWQGASNNKLAWWDEFGKRSVRPNQLGFLKRFMGGQTFAADQKHTGPAQVSASPVLVTSNESLQEFMQRNATTGFDQSAWSSRVLSYRWSNYFNLQEYDTTGEVTDGFCGEAVWKWLDTPIQVST
jgi:hypothetical protein